MFATDFCYVLVRTDVHSMTCSCFHL